MASKIKTKTGDFTADHLGQLCGKRVVAVAKDTSDGEGFYGLKFDDGTVAWVSRDPEGNGPGWLDIQKA